MTHQPDHLSLVREVLPTLPAHIAAKIESGELELDHTVPPRDETADEARARAAIVEDWRRHKIEQHRTAWQAQVPARFRDARLDELDDAQDHDRVPGPSVRAWWASDATNLVLWSDRTDTGKSHAAYAVGNHAVDQGAWVAGWSMIALNEALKPGRDETAYTTAQQCDLLIIDDMGGEQSTPWTTERLLGILDERWANDRRMVVTTNLDGERFVDRYDDRVIDRITDGMWRVKVDGPQRRRPAPW